MAGAGARGHLDLTLGPLKGRLQTWPLEAAIVRQRPLWPLRVGAGDGRFDATFGAYKYGLESWPLLAANVRWWPLWPLFVGPGEGRSPPIGGARVGEHQAVRRSIKGPSLSGVDGGKKCRVSQSVNLRR